MVAFKPLSSPRVCRIKIGINIDEDKLVYIWVDDLTEMETAKYVGLICTLIASRVGKDGWVIRS